MVLDDFKFGKLVEAEYSNSGNMLGNLYYIKTAINKEGTPIVREAFSPQHDVRATIKEYRAPEDLLERISKIADEAGMKEWGKLPMGEFFPLDAATPRIALTYSSADPDCSYNKPISFTAYEQFPEGGHEAFNKISDILSECLTDGSLLCEYPEPERES